MDKQLSRNPIQAWTILLLLICILLPTGGRCEAEAKSSSGSIAILPFETHAPRDLSHLQTGIRVMLASRLAADTGLTVIDATLVDKKMADMTMSAGQNAPQAKLVQLAAQLGVDYLLTGSLTALGEGLSLDANIFSAATPDPPQTFYATAATENDIITSVNKLAGDIRIKLSGNAPPEAAPVPAAAPEPVTSEENQDAHPERAFRRSLGSGAALTSTSSGTSSLKGFTKSNNFDFQLQSLDVGDIDGDGLDDLVMADANVVQVYHRKKNEFILFGSVSLALRYTIHAVSLADLNNNGKAEIYISAADADKPASFAAEWRQNDFVFLLQKEPWFIKAVNLPGQGMILAGQQHGLNSLLSPDVFQLHGNGGEGMPGPLRKGKRLPLPSGINVFDFVFADIDGDREAEIVHIDQEDRLNVLRADGKPVWRSSTRYGGTIRSISRAETVDKEYTINALTPYETVKIFVPCRLIAADLNQDGLTDIVINRNHLRWSPIFKNLKSYNSGQVAGLTWNSINLTELWQTNEVDGYITGYQLRPSSENNGAEALLYVGLNLSEGKQSTVLLYTLNLAEKPAAKE